MAIRKSKPIHNETPTLPLPDQVALVLQGGGALGAYQCGVYQELEHYGIPIDRISGISIGAFNAAILAGNPPEQRMPKLRYFWRKMTSTLPSFPIWPNDHVREFVHEMSANFVATFGVPGFFRPRYWPPFMSVPGSEEALSLYDTSPLKDTLNELVDWNLLNNGPIRVAVGAVEVESGNFVYFDTKGPNPCRIDARHIMASGALPPSLPAVPIDGKLYWDGGIVSNTPLSQVLEDQDRDMLIFQIDLFSASDKLPRTFMDVVAREKEIRLSSRTREITTQVMRERRLHQRIHDLIDKMPSDLKQTPEIQKMYEESQTYGTNVVHLIYRANAWEGRASDYEFSERTMKEHWQAGRNDIRASISQSGVLAENILEGKTATFDLTKKQLGPK